MSVWRFEEYHFAPAGVRGKLGEVPSIARIKRIMSWAMHCQETAAHETTWNSAVHFPLLDMALYSDNPTPSTSCAETYLSKASNTRISRPYRGQAHFGQHRDQGGRDSSDQGAALQIELWQAA